MAIRVLPRILYSTVQLPSIPLLRKIRSFSNPPNLRSQSPSESPLNTQFTHQISLTGVLKRYGFPQSQILQFTRANPFLSASSSSDIENCIRTLLSFGLTQKSLLSVLVNCPKSLQLGFVDELVLALSELGFSAVSSSLISTVLEQSGIFRIGPDDFRRNALTMKKNLGFGKDAVIRVFEELPAEFMKDPVDVDRRIEVLLSYGFEKEEIDGICFKFPLFLAFGVDGRLKPLLQEFKSMKLSGNEVKSTILENPKLVLGMEVGEISRCIDLIRSLKCRVPIKDRIVVNGHFKAGIDVRLRIDLLCNYGLIRRDAFKVLYLEPRSIVYELKDIEKKIEFLLHTMGFNIEHLVEFPDYLGVNLEKHIIPRFNVIELLRSKGGLGLEVGLKHLVRLSRLRFYNLFVKPYPECEEIFGGLIREVQPVVRPRQPPGLWKMFKAQKLPESEKDVQNMKLFVESLV